MNSEERRLKISSDLERKIILPFHFICHSNGTWLLARVLRQYKTVRFDRITLCESQVNRNFLWRVSYEEDRLIRLRNERAAKDYAVGFAANFLGKLISFFRFRRDIGDGGRVGFDSDEHTFKLRSLM